MFDVTPLGAKMYLRELERQALAQKGARLGDARPSNPQPRSQRPSPRFGARFAAFARRLGLMPDRRAAR